MTKGAGPLDVTTTARVLVRAATTTLPSPALRERYRSEHLGELSVLPTSDQIHYAVGALATSWALRRALIKEIDMTATPTRPAKPLLCRFNVHHRWHHEHNLMGEPYRRCLKCGKDDPGTSGPPPANVHF